MPGILPMKVIKVGTTSQARIAQACDRCRSKKIRCDGVRPSCTQCLNVGFECRTSDKLSRRAFPRGYTESLEERVRQLESEVRELKELLDGKDEKIDVLSRIHSKSPHGLNRRPTPSITPQIKSPSEESLDKDDLFKVAQSPLLLDEGSANSYFVGPSSGRTLIDAFNRRVQETGKPFQVVSPESLLEADSRLVTENEAPNTPKAPPRMASDKAITCFFQEFAPIFPVIHRPTFLSLYEEFVNDPEAMTDKKALAQLNLVFGIATLAGESLDKALVDSFEIQWQAALDAILHDASISTLQCLVLAQLYCIQRADYSRLLKYKGIAISLSHRLGLHQSQKRFALGALTGEIRKKVFWTLYTLDCFTAAQLGLPKHFREEDIHCEYPVDADDEYITEKGFLPSLPGEFTKVSSALALFRAVRILGRILEENYPTSQSHDLSFRKMTAQSDELDQWSSSLPSHLKLQFAQDKPSTNMTSSRSPILSLFYNYIRILIWRPVLCADLGSRASAAVLAVAGSCKHIVQIVQLLEERNLGFSLCINKNDLLVSSGFGLLFQAIELDQDSKLFKENLRLTTVIADHLDRSLSPAAAPFGDVVKSMAGVRIEPKAPAQLSPVDSIHEASSSSDPLGATHRHLKAIASRLSPSRFSHNENPDRRATVPNININGIGQHTNPSVQSLNSIHSVVSEPAHAHQARSEPTMSPLTHRASFGTTTPNPRLRRTSTNVTAPAAAHGSSTNLDFLSFGTDPSAHAYSASSHAKTDVQASDEWERLLGGLDNGATNIYDSIYGGAPIDALSDLPPSLPNPSTAIANTGLVWSPEMWHVGLSDHEPHAPPPQSVLSFSDESLTSGSDAFDVDFGSSSTATGSGGPASSASASGAGTGSGSRLEPPHPSSESGASPGRRPFLYSGGESGGGASGSSYRGLVIPSDYNAHGHGECEPLTVIDGGNFGL
ncbi:fungal-specific transcription factor domain-containing protein [Phyllosticta citricarpa]|uniref:Fungal-specific transcription factor domain-containing protein n=1 Tax=Phyllosticta paracitricarpa TaxID=2016321 RepID=A0ABR1MVC6_9PEZI